MARSRTMAEVRAANKRAGHHFFDRDTMQFFSSKIATALIAGRYFITSETPGRGEPRAYTIREVKDNGHIDTVGEFRGFGTLAQAKAAVGVLKSGGKATHYDSGRWMFA